MENDDPNHQHDTRKSLSFRKELKPPKEANLLREESLSDDRSKFSMFEAERAVERPSSFESTLWDIDEMI